MSLIVHVPQLNCTKCCPFICFILAEILTLSCLQHPYADTSDSTKGKYRMAPNFKEHNFRGFYRLALNHENYAPQNNAKSLKTHILPYCNNLSYVVGDRSMVLYHYCDNRTISSPILKVPVKGFRSTLASIVSVNEGTRHAI